MTQQLVWHAWVHGKKEIYRCMSRMLSMGIDFGLDALSGKVEVVTQAHYNTCCKFDPQNTNLQELAEQRVMVVSGHHGTIHVDELRLIIDEGGGLSHLPVTAIILPSREMVRDTDKSNEAASSC